MLASELMSDVGSEVHAALANWPVPLPLLMQIRQTDALMASVGAEMTWPWDAAHVTDDERAQARRLLAERSGVPD